MKRWKAMQVAGGVTVVAMAAAAGGAQARTAQTQGAGAISPMEAGTRCRSTHTFGAGPSFFETCITGDGNILEYKVGDPAGVSDDGTREHIRNGVVIEGYAICTGGTTIASDLGGLGEVGWNPSTVNQPGGANTLPLTIARTSTDGRIKLRQAYEIDGANRTISVFMTVTNLTGAPLTALKVARLVDQDTDSATDTTSMATTARSASAWTDPAGGELTLSATTLTKPATPSIGNFGDVTGDCKPMPGSSPQGPGDGTSKVVYFPGALPAGASVTLKFTYSGH